MHAVGGVSLPFVGAAPDAAAPPTVHCSRLRLHAQKDGKLALQPSPPTHIAAFCRKYCPMPATDMASPAGISSPYLNITTCYSPNHPPEAHASHRPRAECG